MSARPMSYSIEGREFSLPCEVRHAISGAATYLVPATAAAALLAGPEIEIARMLPGKALCSIAMIDYQDNDLGDYNEVSIFHSSAICTPMQNNRMWPRSDN